MADLASTAVLVLAAGLSRRYGQTSKLTALLRNKPLAFHIADTLANEHFARKLAICRPGDDVLVRGLADRGFETVLNPDSARGQASSIALGVEALAKQCPQAILVCLADMPFVTIAHLTAIVSALDADQSVVASKLPDGHPCPPAAFDARHFETLMRLQGDSGARLLLKSALLIAAPPGVLADFDTADDFIAQR